jgi:hypothetical protein
MGRATRNPSTIAITDGQGQGHAFAHPTRLNTRQKQTQKQAPIVPTLHARRYTHISQSPSFRHGLPESKPHGRI